MRIEPWGGPGFEPYEGPQQIAELAQPDNKARDLNNFLRSEQRRTQARSVPPEPDTPLPAGCRWQLDENNEWALLVPQGRHGFTKYSGSREELTEFARHLVPM